MKVTLDEAILLFLFIQDEDFLDLNADGVIDFGSVVEQQSAVAATNSIEARYG